MLLIDRLTEIRPKESARGIKNVTLNDPWFRGHFPEFPIMPGVLIVEAMAQTAGALVVHSSGTAGSHKRVYFMTIDKARFRHPVVPGDVLELPVKAIRRRGPVWKFSGGDRARQTMRGGGVLGHDRARCRRRDGRRR